MWKTRENSHARSGKMAEIGIKRHGYKSLTVDCKAILNALDEYGPLKYAELKAQTNIPKGNLERRLWVLTELQCIVRMDKKYMRHSDIYIYENKTDRDLALNHSKNVASGLQFLISGAYRSRVDAEETLPPNIKYTEHALKHLRTAPKFRKIYDIFEEAEKTRKEFAEEEHRSIRAIKSRLLSTKLKLKHEANIVEIVATEVCKDIKRVLEGRKPIFLTNLKVMDGKTKSGENTLTLAEEFERLRRFIMREEESKENKSAYKRILDLTNKYCTSRADFERLAELLIIQVINGTPLDGKCDICPKVTTLQNAEANKVLHKTKKTAAYY